MTPRDVKQLADVCFSPVPEHTEEELRAAYAFVSIASWVRDEEEERLKEMLTLAYGRMGTPARLWRDVIAKGFSPKAAKRILCVDDEGLALALHDFGDTFLGFLEKVRGEAEVEDGKLADALPFWKDLREAMPKQALDIDANYAWALKNAGVFRRLTRPSPAQ